MLWDELRCFPLSGLSAAGWSEVEPVLLPIESLRLSSWADGGGLPVHVVQWNGDWWVEAGLDYLLGARARGEHHVWCAIVVPRAW